MHKRFYKADANNEGFRWGISCRCWWQVDYAKEETEFRELGSWWQIRKDDDDHTIVLHTFWKLTQTTRSMTWSRPTFRFNWYCTASKIPFEGSFRFPRFLIPDSGPVVQSESSRQTKQHAAPPPAQLPTLQSKLRHRTELAKRNLKCRLQRKLWPRGHSPILSKKTMCCRWVRRKRLLRGLQLREVKWVWSSKWGCVGWR